MKKLICALIVLTAMLSLVACGGQTGAISTTPGASAGSEAGTTDNIDASTGGETSTSGETSGTDITEESTTEVKESELYDTGHFKVLIPAGWKAFPNRENLDVLQMGRGASSYSDLFYTPCVTVNYAGRDLELYAPPKEFYEDVKDLGTITTGEHQWEVFSGKNDDYTMIIFFEDTGEIQYQVSISFKTDGDTIAFDDPDILEILKSITSTNPEDR